MENPSRRGLLRAIGIGSVSAIATASILSSATPANASTPLNSASRWWRMKARMDRLEAEYLRFHNTVVIPADEAVHDEITALPHVSAEYPGWSWKNGERQNWTITTAQESDLRYSARSLKEPEGHEAEYLAACRTIIEGRRDREAAIERIYERHQCESLANRADRIDQLAYKLRWKLMAMPAPDAAAALWKLDYLLGDDGSESTRAWNVKDADVGAAIADIRRHLGGEA